jgi:hypothetical protein
MSTYIQIASGALASFQPSQSIAQRLSIRRRLHISARLVGGTPVHSTSPILKLQYVVPGWLIIIFRIATDLSLRGSRKCIASAATVRAKSSQEDAQFVDKVTMRITSLPQTEIHPVSIYI